MQVADKREAHDLIDRLTAEQIPAAVDLLRSMFLGPADDEPVTEGDIRAFREMNQALARGEKGTPMEEMLTEFGLTMDDVPPGK
jgi:hypothetical protein